MSGIIAIFRDNKGIENLPVGYMVGQVPVLANGNPLEDGAIVSHIQYRESGSAFGKRLLKNGTLVPVVVIRYQDSTVESYVRFADVLDVAYETKVADEVKTPELED